MGMSTQAEIQFAPAAAAVVRDTRVAEHVELLTYTAEQVCAALQISKVTLWRLEKRGLLRALPHLRHKRYPVEPLKRFARIMQ
jgi:hypothetical protein